MSSQNETDEIDLEAIYGTKDAAKLAKVSPSLVSKLCQRGDVKAKKRGPGTTNEWSIPGAEVKRLREAYAPASA